MTTTNICPHCHKDVTEPVKVKVLDWSAVWLDRDTCKVGCQSVPIEDMERIKAMAQMGRDGDGLAAELAIRAGLKPVLVDTYKIVPSIDGVSVGVKSVSRSTIAAIMDARPEPVSVPEPVAGDVPTYDTPLPKGWSPKTGESVWFVGERGCLFDTEVGSKITLGRKVALREWKIKGANDVIFALLGWLRPIAQPVPEPVKDAVGDWFAGLEWWLVKGVRVVAIRVCPSRVDSGSIGTIDADGTDVPGVNWDCGRYGCVTAHGTSGSIKGPGIAPLPLSDQDPDVMRKLGVKMEPVRDWDSEPWRIGDEIQGRRRMSSDGRVVVTGIIDALPNGLMDGTGILVDGRFVSVDALRNLSNPETPTAPAPATPPAPELAPGVRVKIIGATVTGIERRHGQQGIIRTKNGIDTWRVGGTNCGDTKPLVFNSASLEPIQ